MCIKINKIGKQDNAHFSSHFSQQLLMAEIWYLVTSFIKVPHIVGSVFGPSDSYFLFADFVVTKYQISAINSCWEKCDEICAYMFNVYRNQLSRQTGSRNLTGPKMLPTIWYTYMKLVTKYQSSYWWQKSDIWSQASYRYPISWEAFWNHQIPTSCLPILLIFIHI
jgi:hypothetical protein